MNRGKNTKPSKPTMTGSLKKQWICKLIPTANTENV